MTGPIGAIDPSTLGATTGAAWGPVGPNGLGCPDVSTSDGANSTGFILDDPEIVPSSDNLSLFPSKTEELEEGQLRMAKDTGVMYVWTGDKWKDLGSAMQEIQEVYELVKNRRAEAIAAARKKRNG